MSDDSKHKSTLVKKLDIGKKIIDILDDVFIAARGVFGAAIGTIVYASALLGINSLELYEGQKQARKAYLNPETPQRITKIASGAWASFLSTAGLVVASVVLLHSMDAITISTSIMEGVITPILPGLLGLIYMGNLAARSYAFHQLKKEEKTAKEKYDNYLEKLKKKYPVNPEGKLIYNSSSKMTLSEWVEHEILFGQYKMAHEKKIKAEKKVAFSVLELATSMVVVLGATLVAVGVTLFPPAIIIYAGVGLAFSAKLFEYFDENAGPIKIVRDFLLWCRGKEPTEAVVPGRFTKPIRNAFVKHTKPIRNALGKLFGSKETKDLEEPIPGVLLEASTPVVPAVSVEEGSEPQTEHSDTTKIAGQDAPLQAEATVNLEQASTIKGKDPAEVVVSSSASVGETLASPKKNSNEQIESLLQLQPQRAPVSGDLSGIKAPPAFTKDLLIQPSRGVPPTPRAIRTPRAG